MKEIIISFEENTPEEVIEQCRGDLMNEFDHSSIRNVKISGLKENIESKIDKNKQIIEDTRQILKTNSSKIEDLAIVKVASKDIYRLKAESKLLKNILEEN